MSQPTEPDIEVQWVDGDVAYRLTGSMGSRGPELHGVEIRNDVAPLTAADLRSPFVSTFAGKTRKGRPQDLTAASNQLERVAELARMARYGDKGTSVAKSFGISQGYARQLISEARKAGYLTSPP